MAQQVLDDFLKPNQPLEFDQFCSENFSTGNVLNDFRPNLNVIQVEHTSALDIPNNDISVEIMINLMTKTLQR